MTEIAQLNIAIPRYPIDDARLGDFMNNLDRVNAIAERSPGFLWRLKDEAGNATGVDVPGAPEYISNLSVWTSVDALRAFAFQTVHKVFFARREEWFQDADKPLFVMWPVETGHRPDLEEAMARLNRLQSEGPSHACFGWADIPAGL